jgi:Cdc6-like AAA superfamily ATPase
MARIERLSSRSFFGHYASLDIVDIIPMTPEKLTALRTAINESLRVQLGGADRIGYVDPGSFLVDIQSRQNHTVFARRGCGKSLLLHESSKQLPKKHKAIYINCEDYKHHSFPNVLIEILDTLFAAMEKQLTAWFGRKKRTRLLIGEIRTKLNETKNEGGYGREAGKTHHHYRSIVGSTWQSRSWSRRTDCRTNTNALVYVTNVA